MLPIILGIILTSGFIFCYISLAKPIRKALAYARSLSDLDSNIPVTIIKPVKGADNFTKDNFLSWLNQDYSGDIQFIFSFQDPNDPAVEILKNINSKRKFEIIVNPVKEGFMGKMSNLYHGWLLANNNIVIFSDADIEAEPDTLRKIVNALSTGDIVTCIPRHTYIQNTWSKIYAQTWDLGILILGAYRYFEENNPGIHGGTIAMSKKTLENLGGLSEFKDYIAEDVAMGLKAQKLGIKTVYGPVINSPIGKLGFKELVQKIERASLVSEIQLDMREWIFAMLPHSYFFVLILSLILLDIRLVLLSLILIILRTLFLGRLDNLIGRARLSKVMDLDVVLGEILIAPFFFGAMISRKISWGGIKFKVDRDGHMHKI